MTERGILFSAPMVRALLDGSKTQTRRVCKPAEAAGLSYVTGIQDPRDFGQRPLEVPGSGWFGDEDGDVQFRSPYGQPGDRLWVRETWADLAVLSDGNYQRQAIYRADDIEQYGDEDEPVDVTAPDMRWRPSIHMPRWASRILLEIVSVRVERLQDISEPDARAEGITDGGCVNCGDPEPCGCPNPSSDARDAYCYLWEQINGAGSWASNPWVWVVEFRRIQ